MLTWHLYSEHSKVFCNHCRHKCGRRILWFVYFSAHDHSKSLDSNSTISEHSIFVFMMFYRMGNCSCGILHFTAFVGQRFN